VQIGSYRRFDTNLLISFGMLGSVDLGGRRIIKKKKIPRRKVKKYKNMGPIACAEMSVTS
jgi:hypothetical protein